MAQMATSPWQQRIRRAEELARQHSFGAEILGFYIHTAGFQEDLYRRLQASAGLATRATLNPGSLAPEALTELVPHFRSFLLLAETNGPKPLAGLARDLRHQGDSAWFTTLRDGWTAEFPAEAQDLLARAFLQPYAELLRSRAALNLSGYSRPSCPFCRRKAGMGVLRPQGDGASRFLMCFFCLGEWEFRRIVCPACGEEDSKKLPVYTALQFDHIRVECCDSCKRYMKTVNLAKNGLAEPLADEIASVPLDLWAQEHDYSKLQMNLLGM
jgi:Protein involved in formate dehydrogenase formation